MKTTLSEPAKMRPVSIIYCIACNHNENFEKYAYEIVDVVNAVIGMVP